MIPASAVSSSHAWAYGSAASAAARSGLLGSGPEAAMAEDALRRRRRAMRRAAAAGPPSATDMARLLAEFAARGGQVTRCPTAHAVAVNNGAGMDALRWSV